MHSRLMHAALALAFAALSVALSPASGLAQGAPPRQPAGQATQNASVDCDQFADGVHGVPIVVVTDPAPGATLSGESITIQGFAVDCHVDVGAGINRVSVFLGNRDAGGTFLGDATLRAPSPIPVVPVDQYAANSGWALKAQAPLKPGEPNQLFVYARSELTNMETSVMLPVVGAGATRSATPTPAAEPASAPAAPSPTVEPTPEPLLEPEGDSPAPPPDQAVAE